MRWLRRLFRSRPDRPAAAPVPAADDDPTAIPFTCSTCGRTDLPPVGDWDPPICEECDAAINFDALIESGAFDEH